MIIRSGIFTVSALFALLSLASCITLPPANVKSPVTETDRKKASLEARKVKSREYVKLCENTKAAPLRERTAKGAVWLVNMEMASHGSDAPAFYMSKELWPEAFPNSLDDAKNIVCIFPDYESLRRVSECSYDLFFSIPVYSFSTLITFIDLEKNEKIGEKEFVKMPECPKSIGFSPGNPEARLKELRGGPANMEEVIGWATPRWSPY